tara:strand:- start:1076 stop:1732 length:657 start_codon:yes stop_codon:yes gene_type:complete
MSTLKLKGATSGEAEVTVAAAAGTPTITLPTASINFATAGSDGQYLKTNGSGTLSFDTPGGGKILQVVQGSTTTQVEVTATTLTDSGLSASITPSSGTKILVMVNQHYCIYRHDDDNNGGIVLLRDTSIIGSYLKNSSEKYWGLGMDAQDGNMIRIENRHRWNFTYLDTHGADGSTAVTYKTQGAVYAGSDDEKITFQRDGGAGTDAGSYIQLLEVAA